MQYGNVRVREGETLFEKFVPVTRNIGGYSHYESEWTHTYIRITKIRDYSNRETNIIIQCIPVYLEKVGKDGCMFKHSPLVQGSLYVTGYKVLTKKRLAEAKEKSIEVLKEAWEDREHPLGYIPIKAFNTLCKKIKEEMALCYVNTSNPVLD